MRESSIINQHVAENFKEMRKMRRFCVMRKAVLLVTALFLSMASVANAANPPATLT
jgi:hypothetical protein